MSQAKKSYGIACCRFNKKNKLEVLLIKKRYTYNFAAFVLGQYHKKDEKFLKFLFNGMTVQEKLDILSLDFDILWYKIWMEIPSNKKMKEPEGWDIYNIRLFNEYIRGTQTDRLKFYKKKKSRFENLFVINKGKYLYRLIKGTSNGTVLWDIPKGRKHKNETPMDCAIREFQEETGVPYNYYTIMFDIRPIVNSYVNASATYVNNYYIAYESKNIKPQVNFSNTAQITEVQDIRWIDLEEVRFIDRTGHLFNLVNKIFNTFHRKYQKEP